MKTPPIILLLICVGALALLNPIVTWAEDTAPTPEAIDSVTFPHQGIPLVEDTTPLPETGVVTIPAPPHEPDQAVTLVVENIKGGNWKLAVAAILSLLMTLLGKFRGMIPIFAGDRGGSLLVMVLSVLGSVATALGTGAPLDWNLLISAAGVAFTAVGGWTWFNQVIRPADKKKAAVAGAVPSE